MRHLKVYLSPTACPKANVDREKTSHLLKKAGFELTGQPAQAWAALVFGCAFIDDAKRESLEEVLSLAPLKAGTELRRLLVVGCLPQKYATDLRKDLPEVDAFVGNSCLRLIPEILKGLRGEGDDRHVWVTDRFSDLSSERGRCPPEASPWTRTVLICDGCDNACSYCAIPQMRGPLRSRAISDIVEEIDLLLEQGAKEVVLAGQDIASFGRDTDAGLTELVSEVAGRHPDRWIRLSYVNPDNLDCDLADVIAQHPNVCNYLDMPIQHASDRILRMMGRKSGPEILRSRIARLREAVPDISLRTSVIVGFPGETEEDFDNLLEFLQEIQFDLVGVFAYSPQPGTPAARLPHQVPEDLKGDRLIEVVGVQDSIAQAKMQTLVGRTLEVLVEANVGGKATVRSQYDMAEIDRTIDMDRCPARPGDFTRAHIYATGEPYHFLASPP